ncbi:MAG: L-2-hydroxyglutarate oxidase [Planctomycetota bacterium]
MADLTIIGAGLVGLATAREFLRQTTNQTTVLSARPRVVVVEKEPQIASHQSGRNSGVIHSGIYYQPGSDKALLCRRGKAMLEAFCSQHGVPWRRCGKVIVATSASELASLQNIQARGEANGVEHRRIDTDQLRAREPHAAGIAAIEVPETGVVDYRQMAAALRQEIEDAGGSVRTDFEVKDIRTEDRNVILVNNHDEQLRSRRVVACAGLRADQMMTLASSNTGVTCPDVATIPFRGEYYRLRASAADRCQHLIYPVPDPKFPFLGVHFTRGVDGTVHCGPNAVLALSREGYQWSDIQFAELGKTLAFAGFRRMAAKHWRMGLSEMNRSLRKTEFTRALRRLVPGIKADDLIPSPSGVRAQAVRSNGELVDDFLFATTPHMVHVINAPSPAATACLAIAERIIDQLETELA